MISPSGRKLTPMEVLLAQNEAMRRFIAEHHPEFIVPGDRESVGAQAARVSAVRARLREMARKIGGQ